MGWNAMLIDLVAVEDLTIGDMSLKEAVHRRKSHRKFTDESFVGVDGRAELVIYAAPVGKISVSSQHK